MRRPALWLLDEPYASLDDEGRGFFDALIGDVVAARGHGRSSARTTRCARASLTPRTVVLAGGRVAEVPS